MIEDGGQTRGILDHITVIDLTTFVTGGFATLMLANQGAEVVKIEQPGIGDDIRHSGPPFVELDDYDGPGDTATDAGQSPYFWTINYGKRSIELDLKSDGGLATLYDIIAEADVFVENFRPGTVERLGVDKETISEYNENIIYCSISAFGDTGPWRQRPGYDLLLQGMSGIMNVTGQENDDPVKVGLPQADLITAMWAAFGILNAILRRERTGDGEKIELGMFDATIPWLTKQAGKVFAGEQTRRMGTKDPVLSPYQMFQTADGFLNVACGNQRIWEQLCDVLELSDLKVDERFSTNSDRVQHMDELEAELADVFIKKSTDEWVKLLAEEHDIPVGPVFDVEEALTNEQIEAREVVELMQHPAVGEIPVINHPLNYESSKSGFTSPPPLLGEDTEEILREIGYTDEQILDLRERNVIPSE